MNFKRHFNDMQNLRHTGFIRGLRCFLSWVTGTRNGLKQILQGNIGNDFIIFNKEMPTKLNII
jgi:hypothetical protein